jgi:ribonucleoside-diphosphate reductase alpha chain
MSCILIFFGAMWISRLSTENRGFLKMQLSKNAQIVLEKRYLVRNAEGKTVEDISGLFNRVAEAVAQPDKLYNVNADIEKTKKTFYNVMTNLEFLPNSPTLMNAGRPLGQLSACFVLPVEDTMEAIFEAIKQAALIHKSGGGTGFSFSRLRQKGSTVNSTGGVASGPVSFMRVFNMATEAVKQGGTRRGANMGILRIDHPDILEFIDCKRSNTDITNFNISVGITEKFMEAVINGEDYDLIDPSTKKVISTLNAKEIFDKIVDAAWQNGEPGIIFLDRLNRDNVVPKSGEIESTNPCGEQPLLPYESCNLGSINLYKMIHNVSDKWEIDWDKLETTVKTAVHFLDNVIDANRYPLKLIDEMTKSTRKIGLGVMGWADMLLKLEISYSSSEAVALAEKVMSFVTNKAREKSIELAEIRGAFPLFSESTLSAGAPMRNATVTTIAPTGTLSIIADCSSGVEPIFAYAYVRNVMDGTELIEVNTVLKQELVERGLYSDDIMKKVIEAGTIAHTMELPEDIRKVFVCAHDISAEAHIKSQAAFQMFTDNAVSKTVNFPNSATREDVYNVYMMAYKLGCKGVTIYRDGSRNEQVLNIGKVNKDSSKETISTETEALAIPSKLSPRPRPEVTSGFTEKVKIGCGNLYITVNYDDNGICEVFTNTGRAGGCPSQSEATSRLVSIALRSGIDADSIIEQLKGIRCPSTIRQAGMKCSSCPDAIARVIDKVKKFQNGQQQMVMPPVQQKNEPIEDIVDNTLHLKYCNECGSKLEHEGGCVMCRNCGYSKCG